MLTPTEHSDAPASDVPTTDNSLWTGERDGELVRGPTICARADGVSSTTWWRWRKYRDFPKPDMTIANVDYWRWGTVRRWFEAHGKREAV